MVTTSRADLSGAMGAFKDHGKTHEALFGREHLAGFRWLHERYRFAGHRVHWRLDGSPGCCPQTGRLWGVGLAAPG